MSTEEDHRWNGPTEYICRDGQVQTKDDRGEFIIHLSIHRHIRMTEKGTPSAVAVMMRWSPRRALAGYVDGRVSNKGGVIDANQSGGPVCGGIIKEHRFGCSQIYLTRRGALSDSSRSRLMAVDSSTHPPTTRGVGGKCLPHPH